jgi:hypothetical protein
MSNVLSKKTHGQQLYEYKHPATILVVPFALRHFATREDVFEVPNPNFPVPWTMLTQRARDIWERSAIGHHLFARPEGE